MTIFLIRSSNLTSRAGIAALVRPDVNRVNGVELRSGERVRNVVFRLQTEAVLAGRVVDPEGNPLSNVNVQALRQSYARGFRELVPAGRGITGSDGSYRIDRLAAGHYYLWAERSSPAPIRSGPPVGAISEGFVGTFYPASPDVVAAVKVQAYAGAETAGLDITLNKAPTAVLRGRVLNPLSQGGQRTVLVRLHPEGLNFGSRFASVKDLNGNFEVRGLRPDAYIISAEWIEGEQRFTARQQVIVRDTDIDDLTLVVARGSPIRGVVRSDNRQSFGLGSVGIVLESHGPIATNMSAQAAESGEFTLPDVPPNTYGISLSGLPADCYLKSVRFGAQQVSVSRFEYSGVPGSLDITFGLRRRQNQCYRAWRR